MKKKKFDKATAVYVGVIALLILIFIGIFTYGLDKVLAMEGTMEPHEVTEGISPAPTSSQEGVDYLNRVVKNAIESKPAVSRENGFSVDNVTFEGNEKLTKFASYISDGFESTMEDGMKSFEKSFGEGFEKDLMKPNLDVSDIVMYEYCECSQCGRRQDELSETCDDCKGENTFLPKSTQVFTDYVFYTCPSCGETSNIPLEKCEECGSARPYYKTYNDNYKITMSAAMSALNKSFAPLNVGDVGEIIGDSFDGFLKLENYMVEYTSLDVYYEVERSSDKLQCLEYRKGMKITASVLFEGEYKALGSGTVTFTAIEKNRFNFTWPGLELDKHELVIEPKGTDNLLATLICDKPTEYKVTWGSMNTNICTVDEEGYLKAGKEPGETTIVAKYTFNGAEYEDSCKVLVRVPVEGLSINKRDVELNAGETFKLFTTTDPKDATVTSVKWYSENEKIATVNENGLVTAKAKGVVTVYALSDDGYFKSSCEVTVK